MLDLEALERATTGIRAPFALVDMDALWANAGSMTSRARGKPIRLASKSVRCRHIQERVLATQGFRGTLAFTLPEALWLASHGFDDIVVAYPTADRDALAELGRIVSEDPERRIAVMVDSEDHLDLIGLAAPGAPIQVAMDIDAGFWLGGGRIKVGAKRSPIHTVEQAVDLARAIERRKGLRLTGVMLYEAQIAGVGDEPAGKPLMGMAVRAMQKRSRAELKERRAEIVSALGRVTDLGFVNGGGTGSIDSTAAEDCVTEIGAGSGLYAPALFDNYRSFTPVPAAMFALPVVRKPAADTATLLGGGYLASGAGDTSRLPSPHLPAGLRLDKQEGAGEVQTPVTGRAATSLKVGDRVYMRHAKAGELCERFTSLHLIENGVVVDEVPTYRGEGQAFL